MKLKRKKIEDELEKKKLNLCWLAYKVMSPIEYILRIETMAGSFHFSTEKTHHHMNVDF